MDIARKKVIQKLLTWRGASNRQPLILRGARQVGKTTIVSIFGAGNFKKMHTLNFLKDKLAHTIFAESLSPKKIIEGINAFLRTTVDTRTDLLFLDEIQECSAALTSLKFFREDMPELAVIAAGSYLGIMKNEAAFPVGKVDFMTMNPLDFPEFLESFDSNLFGFYEEFNPFLGLPPDGRIEHVPQIQHARLLEALRLYWVTGGLPQSVVDFLCKFSESSDVVSAARVSQERLRNLVESYQADFSKHAGTVNANHIIRVFSAVPEQLGIAQDESV
ncbi:MAG: AAA family ATPase, partial [Oligoflexales bacterium]|nr:AAA family ATPase [Oligoflexales bacterium]